MILWSLTCHHSLEEWLVPPQQVMVPALLVGWDSPLHLPLSCNIHLWQCRVIWGILTLLRPSQADLLPHPQCQHPWVIYLLRCQFNPMPHPWVNICCPRTSSNHNSTWCSSGSSHIDKEHPNRSVMFYDSFNLLSGSPVIKGRATGIPPATVNMVPSYVYFHRKIEKKYNQKKSIAFDTPPSPCI